MYLINDPDDGSYVFCELDPRTEGFAGKIHEDVEIVATAEPAAWTAGQPSRHCHLGRSPVSDRKYQVFTTRKECSVAGFEPLGENFRVLHRWPAEDEG